MGKIRILLVFAAMLSATCLVACGSSSSSGDDTATETGTVTFRGAATDTTLSDLNLDYSAYGTPSQYWVQPQEVWIYKGGTGCTAFNSADSNWQQIYPTAEHSPADVCNPGFTTADATAANGFFDLVTNPDFGNSTVTAGTYACMYNKMCDELVAVSPSTMTQCYNDGERYVRDVWRDCGDDYECIEGGTDYPQNNYEVYFGVGGATSEAGGRGTASNPFALSSSVTVASGGAVTFVMSFNINNGIGYGADNIPQCDVMPPTISISAE